jgi:hypothetical protein
VTPDFTEFTLIKKKQVLVKECQVKKIGMTEKECPIALRKRSQEKFLKKALIPQYE